MYVPMAKEGIVWCNACSTAIGTVLEVNGEAVEDASWLKKKDELCHISQVELEYLLKG